MDSQSTLRRAVNLLFVCLCFLPVDYVCLGDEPWKRHTIDSSGIGADGVRLADFNRDGNLDIVTGWEESGVVRLYLNPGPDKSTERWPFCQIGEGKSPEDAVPFDVNGDGILEVISCHEGSFKQVLVHKFQDNRIAGKAGDQQILDRTNWSTDSIMKLSGQQWMFATPIQLRNSRRGIVLGSKGAYATLTLLLQPSQDVKDLNQWSEIKLRDCGWIMSIQNIDMDQDGDIDIVFSDRKTRTRIVAWLEQPNNADAKGMWKEHAIGATKTEPMFIDATPNRILVPTRQANWIDFRRQNHNSWEQTVSPTPDSVPFGKAIRTFGENNLVLTANTAADREDKKQPGIWLQIPGSAWQPIGTKIECKFDRIELVDLDADGDLDIITCEERQQLGVVWYENPGIK